jgi:two-component system OmpR family response regulator
MTSSRHHNRVTGDRPPRDAATQDRFGGLTSRRSARILIVDDEAPIVEMLTATLTFAGFEVRSARTCAEAQALSKEFAPELALLDVMLPDGSGFDLCRVLRQAVPELGVVFLTARDGIDDKLTGLSLGGDDYVTKPFSVAEVVARLNVLLRRLGSPGSVADRSTGRRVGDLEMNEETHRVSRGGRAIDLSPTEFKLLSYLIQNAELVVSKQQILSQVWRYDFHGDAAVVEKFISQLRRKIDGEGEAPLLHTVRGFGYVLRESQ